MISKKTILDGFKLLIAAAAVLSIVGCSTISTNKRAANLSAITENKTYQLRYVQGISPWTKLFMIMR